jgi:hypothetical protein
MHEINAGLLFTLSFTKYVGNEAGKPQADFIDSSSSIVIKKII